MVDGSGTLLTFLVWNQRAERDERYLSGCKKQILKLLRKGYRILFEDWDEYTAEYLRSIDGQEDFSGQVFLYGRNWELDEAYGRYPLVQAKDRKAITVNKEGIFYPTEERPVYPFMRMKEKYLYKSLYFFMDMNRHISLFSAKFLCGYGCLPEGFCELGIQRETESFLGKTVEDAQEAADRPESLIVYADQIDLGALKEYVPQEKLVCYYDLFEFSAGMEEGKLFQTWGKKEQISAFMKKVYFRNLHIPYRNYKDKDDMDGILLWEVMGNRTPKRHKEYMEQVNGNVDLYSVEPLYETHWSAATSLFIRNLQEALDKGKKAILYGIRSHYTSLWLHILQMLGLAFEIMEEEEQEEWYGYCVGSVHELPFYDTDCLLVINNQPYGDLPYAAALLDSYGVSKERHNYVSLYEEIDRPDRGANMVDLCAGPLCELLAKQPIPGYVTIGENRDSDYKILVVGGSTSDSAFYQYRSWPEQLSLILEGQERSVTIYSGGMAGALSAQELSKLTRDIQGLQPDMVISFSGFNDSCDHIMEPGYVNGIYTDDNSDNRNWFRIWFENEKRMKAVSDLYHAKFFCFAQPILYLGKSLDRYSLLTTKYVRRIWNPDWGWREKVKGVRDCPWFVDLMDIFKDCPEVFFDCCHVTDEGNRIIARHIYEHIKDDIT